MLRFLALLYAVTVCASGQWPGPGRKPNLAAPAPKTPGGKPDLSGVWQLNAGNYVFDVTAELKPGEVQKWAQDVYQQHLEALGKDRWSVTCLPGGPALGLDKQIAKIVQMPGLLVILYEDLTYRQIFLDGRALARDANPTWMGYSTGKWEGEALVVESAGFNDRTWLDYLGHPHTEALRITERYHRNDYGHISLETTYNDPKTYSRPWTIRTTLTLAVNSELLEYVCAENERDRSHMVGKASDDLKKAVTVAPEVLARYAGAYEILPPGARIPVTLNVKLLGTELTMDFNGRIPLTPLSETTFTTPPGARIEFFLNDQGAVTHLVVTIAEGDLRAVRKR